MIYYVVGTVLLLALAVLGFWWYRRRQAQRHRLIAIVGLLKSEKFLDGHVVAAAAKRAWNADLGDADNEGADGFVVGASPSVIVMYQGRMMLVNNFPGTYVSEPEKASEKILNLRLRPIMSEHKAWFSCDAMGIDHQTPSEEIKEWYALLGKLFVELLDDECLGIFLPDPSTLFPNNQETQQKLLADDVVAALSDTDELPIIQVSSDDSAMKAAVAKARETWPQFVSAYEGGLGHDFSVKAPITSQGNTEFIWLNVTAMENDIIYGTLGNDPGDLPGLKLGSKVKTTLSDLNDWAYIDKKGELVGGVTVNVVLGVMKRGK